MPPEGYTIWGGAKGGAAGFAKGAALVRLIEEEDGTRLTYEVDANVGRKLARLEGLRTCIIERMRWVD